MSDTACSLAVDLHRWHDDGGNVPPFADELDDLRGGPAALPGDNVRHLLEQFDAAKDSLYVAVKQRFAFGSSVNLPVIPACEDLSNGRVIGFLPAEPDQVAIDVQPNLNRSRTVYVPLGMLLDANPLTNG
jgi:hypothetical protein